MKIDCIADLHGHYPQLEGGDLLIVAGDLTARDDEKDWRDFDQWLYEQNYKEKILISGNHDNFLQSMDEHRMWKYWEKNPGVTYLCDSGTEFTWWPPEDNEIALAPRRILGKKTFKIWGSPWTKTFPGINPKCKAFTVDTEEELAEKFAKIPDDVDILVTHSPPEDILDEIIEEGYHVGSVALYNAIKRRNIKLHIFGHVHESYGKLEYLSGYPVKETIFVNASHVDENYRPVNKPIRIEL